jgi:hypothetical protein
VDNSDVSGRPARPAEREHRASNRGRLTAPSSVRVGRGCPALGGSGRAGSAPCPTAGRTSRTRPRPRCGANPCADYPRGWMSPPALVLDTNIYSFARAADLQHLSSRGLVLRVSDVALLEAWARSVRQYAEGEPLRKARGTLFARARSVASYLDKETPIAVGGGQLTRLIVARADGTRYDSEGARYIRHLHARWRTLVGPGMSDEQWIANGRVAQGHLDKLDREFMDLARREEELRKKPPPNDVDPATLPALYEQWDALSSVEQLALLRDFLKDTWRLSEAAAERLDCHIRVTALRLHLAALGARMPKENDGADVSLTLHLGEACVLVTNETHSSTSSTSRRPSKGHGCDVWTTSTTYPTDSPGARTLTKPRVGSSASSLRESTHAAVPRFPTTRRRPRATGTSSSSPGASSPAR